MGNAQPLFHARSYMPNTMFLWLIIQLQMTIKPAHKILTYPTENVEVSPIYEYFLLFYRRINMAVVKLYRDQIFSHTIYLYKKKFDWLFIVEPIWLVWHTYITHSLTHSRTHAYIPRTHARTHARTHSLTHSLTHSSIDPSIIYPDAPIKRFFFTKKKKSRKGSYGKKKSSTCFLLSGSYFWC